MKYQKIIAVFLFGLVFSLLAPSVAQAADYYVATNGNDGAAGTQAAPFRTIGYAVRRMQAGDTTYVRGGTYNERSIHFGKTGTAAAPIKLLNYPGEMPIVNFSPGKSGDVFYRFILDAPGVQVPIGWITIEGFEIGYGWEGIKFSDAHDITIRRNWIHHGVSQGVLGTTGKNILIDRNIFSNNGHDTQLDHAMYLTGSNYVITNNLIYGSATHGIQVAGYSMAGSSLYKPRVGPDPDYSGASDFLIANNTFAYNGGPGVVIWHPEAKNNRVINNIFYENGADPKRNAHSINGVNFLNSGNGHQINNNIFYASGAGGTVPINLSDPGVFSQSGNITANPSFVGAGATLSGVPNFKLQAASPAIDGGQNLATVTWDIAGGARPFGGGFDIGAYEFGAPPDSGSPPPNPVDTGGGGGGASCPPPAAGTPTLHLAVSGEQLLRFANAVKAGAQPETATYAAMRTINCRTYANHAIDTYVAPSQNAECVSGSGYCRWLHTGDSKAAWSCAIQGYVENDPALYEASAKIIRAWASRFQRITGSDAQLVHGYAWNHMIWAADLLEAVYTGFTAADATSYRDMLRNRVLPEVSRLGYVLNWESWRAFATYTVSLYLQDAAAAGAARARLLSHITSYVGDGYSMETFRDMWHAQMGIAPLALAAETAHHRGDDTLYEQDNKAILRASEHAANIFFTLSDGDRDPVTGATMKNMFQGPYSYYQVIAHHYGDRLGLPTPSSAAIVASNRFEWKNNYRNGVELLGATGWGTAFYRGTAPPGCTGTPSPLDLVPPATRRPPSTYNPGASLCPR